MAGEFFSSKLVIIQYFLYKTTEKWKILLSPKIEPFEIVAVIERV